LNKIDLNKIKLESGFWKNRVDLLSDQIVPYQWDTLNNRTPGVPLSHAVENFKIAAGESQGEPEGTIFQDSDVAKWIEAAAYSLLNKPNAELEAYIDELIHLIGKSQHENGYVNTFFTAKGIEQRWTDLVMGHEMYCAGHLIEAAVAYYKATGKRELIDIMCRYVDLIDQEFGPEDHKMHSYDGHPEIELALYRLAEVTEEERYKDLADYFMNIRGTVDKFYKGVAAKEGMIPKSRWFESDYYVAHKPVREMEEVTGHSVRAVYLYSGLADQYNRTKEPALWDTLQKLWDNLEQKRLYVTAGIGSQAHGERFTVDYDLPSAMGYTETCASIGLVFWAWRMLMNDPDSRYADMIERALFNGALSGISLDGKGYFYVNPLEVKPEVAQYRHDYEHVETHRLGWFDCACCPTNIARLIGSVAEYIYSYKKDSLYIHQFSSSETEVEIDGTPVQLKQQTQYPWNGTLQLTVDPVESKDFTLFIRQPSWCGDLSIGLNGSPMATPEAQKGYIPIKKTWNKGDRIEIELEMKVQFLQGHDKIDDLAGKTALSYGPVIYCFEEVDNGADLQQILLDPSEPVEVVSGEMEPAPSVNLLLHGYREENSDSRLYRTLSEKNKTEKVKLRAVPYFQWGNRVKDQEMRIWMRLL